MLSRPLAVLLGVIGAVGLLVVVPGVIASASAQSRPLIFDVQLGTPVGELPVEDFVEPACGTNGGPPGIPIGSFEEFAKCRPEDSGLREVWFVYDDEEEFIARAMRDEELIARKQATTILRQPVVLSLLIDDDGKVQGYRIFTDTRADAELRLGAFRVAFALRGRFGREGWECANLEALEGETPINGLFLKERCEKETGGARLVVTSRHYYRPGQAHFDPHTQALMPNSFESSASLQLIRSDLRPEQ